MYMTFIKTINYSNTMKNYMARKILNVQSFKILNIFIMDIIYYFWYRYVY